MSTAGRHRGTLIAAILLTVWAGLGCGYLTVLQQGADGGAAGHEDVVSAEVDAGLADSNAVRDVAPADSGQASDVAIIVDAAVADAALPDAALPDAAIADAALPDAAIADAALPDAALPDAAAADSALPDAAEADSALPDAALPDAALPDAAVADVLLPDAAQAGDAGKEWRVPSHLHRRRIDVSPTHIDADLDRFPALVSLNASRINFVAASPGGDDLIFLSEDGVRLPHEVELWDAAQSKAVVWVQLPSIPVGPDSTHFWMYYDSAEATISEPGEVWTAYRAVYHLDNAADSTGRYGAGYTNAAPEEDAAVGTGLDFTVPNRTFTIDEATDLAQNVSQLSISAWVQVSSAPISSFAYIFGASINDAQDPNWSSRFAFYLNSNLALNARARVPDDHSGVTETSPNNAIGLNTWHKVDAVFDIAGTGIRLYVDGLQVASGLFAYGSARSEDSSSERVTLGCDEGRLRSFLVGYLDEVRISWTALDAAWIKADYASQTDDLLSFGLDETRP